MFKNTIVCQCCTLSKSEADLEFATSAAEKQTRLKQKMSELLADSQALR